MGYPMTYTRVINRNRLTGGYGHRKEPPYSHPTEQPPGELSQGLICGDLRRLEMDQRDDAHLQAYAKATGLTEAQVLHVLDLFFEGNL